MGVGAGLTDIFDAHEGMAFTATTSSDQPNLLQRSQMHRKSRMSMTPRTTELVGLASLRAEYKLDRRQQIGQCASVPEDAGVRSTPLSSKPSVPADGSVDCTPMASLSPQFNAPHHSTRRFGSLTPT